MKTLLYQLLLVSLLSTTGCKRSGGMPFSYTVSRSGSITMTVQGTGKKVEIVTDDYELKVNGVPYGTVDEGDLITVEGDKVLRNGERIMPANQSDQTADQTAAPQGHPVQIQVIAPAVEKQFSDEFGAGFVRVGKVRYDGSSDVYLVEVFYTEESREERYVMECKRIRWSDRPNFVNYRGTFPAALLGDRSTTTAGDFVVTIDELMNEQSEGQQGVGGQPATPPRVGD